ncbi:hypothetical protein LguiA_002780 [Lonicera macranthoides]
MTMRLDSAHTIKLKYTHSLIFEHFVYMSEEFFSVPNNLSSANNGISIYIPNLV